MLKLTDETGKVRATFDPSTNEVTAELRFNLLCFIQALPLLFTGDILGAITQYITCAGIGSEPAKE